MSFWSNVFGKKKDISYVRKWADEQKRIALSSNNFSLDDVFVCMIWGISQFCKDLKQYPGDASLFEFTCYFLFETDLWLYDKNKKYRNDVCCIFFKKSVELFSSALNVENIHELIADRIEIYGKIARGNDDSKEYIDILMNFIILAKSNEIPKKYDTQHNDIVRQDFFELFENRMSISMSILYMLQAHYQMLDGFFSVFDSVDSVNDIE